MIVLGFGSNIGERAEYIETAVKLLADKGVVLQQLSSLYETAPVGYLAQPAFLNAVGSFSLADGLTPVKLLHICQSVEKRLGRNRDIHWGPRTIDIDLLVFDNIIMQSDELVLPHPLLAQRRFVLVPLAEVTAEPLVDNCSAQELLANCSDNSAVVLYKR